MIELSARARMLTNQTLLEPQGILEIEGLPLFGIREVYRYPRFDDPGLFFDTPGLFFDDVIRDPSAHALIDLSGSTKTITQQLFQDRGIAASVTSMTISLVDKDQILTKILSPGVVIEDLLSRKANFYLNFGRGAHPEDSMPVLFGVVDSIDAGSTTVKLKISHPEGLKRQDLFTRIQAKATARLRYRSKQIQGINYQAQDQAIGNVYMAIISGGTKGSETVSVSGNTVTVQANTTAAAPADRSTAAQIVAAIRKTQAAINLIDAKTLDGSDGLAQAAFPATMLESDTTLPLDTVGGICLPSDDGSFLTYIKVDEEIIQYTGVAGNTLTGLTRGCFGTIPRTYEIDQDCHTFYRISGSMKDVALKMMLSRGTPIQNVEAFSFKYVDAQTSIPNGIIFANLNVRAKYGVTVGDYVLSQLADNPANIFTWRRILSIETNTFGSYVIVDGDPLTEERDTEARLSFKSKYDVWPDGLGMQLDQVDVQEHEDLTEFFPSGFFDYDFYLKDTIRGDEFLEKEVYRPSGCYGLPRAGRCSLGITLPPLAKENTKTLDESNIVNPADLRIQRSYTEYFYNSVVYKFDEDAIEDEFLKGVVELSARSIARIPNVKNMPMRIESKGIRDTVASREKISTQVRRILDRYQFGAEKVSDVEVLFKVGFDIEVGDTVIFGSEKLQMSDSTIGSRRFRPRVMEVVNRRLDLVQGRVWLDLLNTAYSVDAKYGVVSPSSQVAAGATTTRVPLAKSFSTPEMQLENYKWKSYVGQKVMLRAEDWSEAMEGTLRGFEDANPNTMIINPPLPAAPGEGWIIEIPHYPASTDPNLNSLYKTMHVFFNPQVPAVASSAPNKIEVSAGDIGKFLVGSPIDVHNEDYSDWTKDFGITVKEINGNVLTLSRDITFGVTSAHVIELIGFPDGGAPYRLL